VNPGSRPRTQDAFILEGCGSFKKALWSLVPIRRRRKAGRDRGETRQEKGGRPAAAEAHGGGNGF